MDWLNFTLALAAFFGSHLVMAVPWIKARLKSVLGQKGYDAVYRTLATAVLVWVLIAAHYAPHLYIWYQRPWMRWVANIAMPVSILLAVLALGAPNPLSFGGRKTGFDPERPGIAGFVRHPLLWSLFLWAAAHVLVNGDVAHVILFGSLAFFCLLGMPVLDRRRQRELGHAEWCRLSAHTSNLPHLRWPGHLPLLRLAIALIMWAAIIAAHPYVIGVSPLPF